MNPMAAFVCPIGAERRIPVKNWDTLEADVTKLVGVHYTPYNGTRRIRGVVLHHNAGNLSVDGCWSVWQTREASAHYQVEESGRIGQLVWDNDIAWHAGDANSWSIGIEHADCSTSPWLISEATLDNGAHLVAAICRYYGLGRPEYGRNVWFHSDFMATSCPASIAGTQRDAYLSRAGQWYDAMAGTANNPTEEEDMPTAREIAQEVWGFKADDSAGQPNNLQPNGNPYETLKTAGQTGGFAFTVKDADHNDGATVYWLNVSTMKMRGFGVWAEWEAWCKLMHCPTDKYAKLTADEFKSLKAFVGRGEEKID